MKLVAITLLFVSGLFVSNAQDMTAESIIESYIETVGGEEAWSKIENIKMKANVAMGGMEIPLEITYTKVGQSASVANFQGMSFYQNMFDGEVLWSTNQMTMAAEKGESEDTENMKRSSGEFPGALFTYEAMGYTVELDGEATKEGVECYKLKMTKNTQLVDGEEKDNIMYFYMDKESFIPIMEEQEIFSGQMKGKISQTLYSDYQEVDGVYFAFSMTQQIEGMGGQEIVLETVEVNVEIDEDIFKFPG